MDVPGTETAATWFDNILNLGGGMKSPCQMVKNGTMLIKKELLITLADKEQLLI